MVQARAPVAQAVVLNFLRRNDFRNHTKSSSSPPDTEPGLFQIEINSYQQLLYGYQLGGKNPYPSSVILFCVAFGPQRARSDLYPPREMILTNARF